jgi:hypothetical protein
MLRPREHTCRAVEQPSQSFREIQSRTLIHRSSTLLTGLKTKGDTHGKVLGKSVEMPDRDDAAAAAAAAAGT